ncbi:hypothetical protein BC832DRAFT_546066 [Gaertneriomyces semiglobifer]|nr:hypothetical protein BC832DRAFT_546066 [Gaertneriomyces semiglobifer]
MLPLLVRNSVTCDSRMRWVDGSPRSVLAQYERPIAHSTSGDGAIGEKVVASDSDMTAKTLLLQNPPGAYTAGRTIKHLSLLDLPAHLTRLSTSLSNIRFTFSTDATRPAQVVTCPVVSNESGPEEPPAITQALEPFRNSQTLPRYVTPLIRAALKKWLLADPKRMQDGVEAKITVLVTYLVDHGAKVLVLCDELFQPKTNTCDVTVYGMPRKNATAKDSKWVTDRLALEKLLSPTVQEVLLTDPHLNIYEGLTSNFCAIVPDVAAGNKPYVQCAPLQYVLLGTILQMVKKVCERENIDFRFEFPRIVDVNQWLGAFICSTSRAVLPVRGIDLRDGRAPVELPKHCETIERIQKALADEMQQRATPLLTPDELMPTDTPGERVCI